ncbi:hypothetical protein E5676_scaffold416G00510 [Cucumis melo var. makuwa]|uniref:Uncharacterized protein n=1 Tax=Cucumis melo var. makuwa TaxID=1194695 RepID=A0A5D3D7S2_CUCMM|nr:hypothetical protein E6C27_scaffold233G00130 [Cucumis melo var. makuwa]TYK19553.1 hypothetical protein E5676_scaffold416G00510 [Cucumis melo var. makuwa]
MEEKQNREKTKAKKTRKEGEDARLCQTFQEKKKNVESLAEMKEKLAKIQTAKKVETKELAKFDDQVEGLEMKNEATENQKVNCLEVVAAEFQEEGDTKVKIDVVDMFYATKFHPIDMYATMDVEKVSFHAEVINELYGLPDEAEMYLGHQLIKYPTKANVGLFFVKKKILPMWHDSMVPFEYDMLLYCILIQQTFDMNTIIQSGLLAWMENPKGAKPSPSIVEKPCLKYAFASNPSRRKKVVSKKVHLVGSISSSRESSDHFLPPQNKDPPPTPKNHTPHPLFPQQQTLPILPPYDDQPPSPKSYISISQCSFHLTVNTKTTILNPFVNSIFISF